MAARVCDTCKARLPTREGFLKCPRCKTQTRYATGVQPMSEEAYQEFRRSWEPEKFANEQILVVYAGKGGNVLPYDTGYDQDQAQRSVRHCVELHGRAAGVRCIFAPAYPLAEAA